VLRLTIVGFTCGENKDHVKIKKIGRLLLVVSQFFIETYNHWLTIVSTR